MPSSTGESIGLIEAKQILSSWSDGNSWFGSNYHMNIYRGCSHGCIYCDSRSDCYRIERFDEVKAKAHVLELLGRELRSKKRKGIVASGAMSDPYNPWEEHLGLTRSALELFHKHGFGASLLTKSDLIVRDIDALLKIKEHSPAVAKLTITTYDDELARKLEPNVAPSSRRFGAVKELSRAGILTWVLLWPVLPFVNDTEENIRDVIRGAAESGARFVSPWLEVTLRQNQRVYFYEQLDRLFPGVKQKYVRAYGNAYECVPTNVEALWAAFEDECQKHGLLYTMEDVRAAVKGQRQKKQLTLFDAE